MSNHIVSSGDPVKRIAKLLPALLALLVWSACGSGSPTTPTSGAKNRAFVSNVFSGNLQIVDTQNDTTPLTAQTTNSNGQVIPGQPVTISGRHSVTFEVESPDHTTTLVYDPDTFAPVLHDQFDGSGERQRSFSQRARAWLCFRRTAGRCTPRAEPADVPASLGRSASGQRHDPFDHGQLSRCRRRAISRSVPADSTCWSSPTIPTRCF